MLSFVVPAHNEERWIEACVSSIHTAMETIAEPYELIVVDDASTDATAATAEQTFNKWRQPGSDKHPTTSTFVSACVLGVNHRKISAVRNAGVRASTGDILFFIDADTQANEPAIRASLAALRAGASGGGCAPELDGTKPVWARIVIWLAVKAARRIRMVGGCFQFCTRSAFDAIGGYDEKLRAGEDIAFCNAIKRIGRFVVPGPTVVTSSRKLGVASPWQVFKLLVTIAIRGPHYESEWIIDILYGDRAQACKNADVAISRNAK